LGEISEGEWHLRRTGIQIPSDRKLQKAAYGCIIMRAIYPKKIIEKRR
jgi:hypothetical protein